MKYPIPAVVFGSLIALCFAVAGIALAKHLLEQPSAPPKLPPVANPPRTPPAPVVPVPIVNVKPFTLEEVAKLQDRKDLTAEEIGRLVACFGAKDADLCMQAELTLNVAGAKAVGPVRGALKHTDAHARLAAAETLGWIGAPAADAAADLVAALRDEHPGVRRKSAYALGRLGVKSVLVTSSLVGVLDDKDEDVVETALEALEGIGPAAAPSLCGFAAVSKGATRERVLASLTQLGTPPPEALPILVELTKCDAPGARHLSIALLGRMGDKALPTFKDLLKKSNRDDYLAIVAGMQNLGPKAKALLPEFTAEVEAEGRRTSTHIDEGMVQVFKACGPDGAKSMAAILKNLEGEAVIYSIRIFLLKGIGQMGEDALPALPMLIEMLNKNDGKRLYVAQRGHLLEALGDLGPIAKEGIPAVRALTNDSMYGELARSTLKRLGVIEPKGAPN